MSQTVTETVSVESVIKEQFLSADLDEVTNLQNLAKQNKFNLQLCGGMLLFLPLFILEL